MSQRTIVLSRYRELLRLIKLQPPNIARQGLQEARQTLHSRRDEADPEVALSHLKELVARISFLKITTPRHPTAPLGGGTFVLRDGELVESRGEDKGTRCVHVGRRRIAAHAGPGVGSVAATVRAPHINPHILCTLSPAAPAS